MQAPLANSLEESIHMLRGVTDKQTPHSQANDRARSIDELLRTEVDLLDEALRHTVACGETPATNAAAHLFLAGGKRVRPTTVFLAGACFGPATQTVRELAVASELVHLATLLHDDVIDDGMERRGVATARRVWGNAVSVLAGDLLLTHALARVLSLADNLAMHELIVALRTLVDGEVLQLRGRSTLCLDEEMYFQVIEKKTASLFVWAARAGARAGGAKPSEVDAMGAFGAALGAAFQLVDDVLDYAGDAAQTGKQMHSDLLEGKATLPLIRAVACSNDLSQHILAACKGEARALDLLAEGVRSTRACDSVRRTAASYTARAVEAIRSVPNTHAKTLLTQVAEHLAERVQ